MEQAAAIDSPSSAQSGDSAAQSPKTINVLPRSPLLHIPQSVVQTLKMASKYTIIPAKGRMILLNSPVLLHRDALVEASLDAIKQSQEAGVVDMTGDQETPVFEVIQEPEKKISVYGDDTVEKTNDIDDVINDMKSKLPKSKDPKIKLVYKSISKSKSHSSDTSSFKSHSSDTATSKSHISDTATSKSHSSGTSTSKSHSSDTSTSKSHISDTATPKSHISDTATSKSHSSDASRSKSHISDTATSKSHSSDTSTSKSHISDTATSKSHSSDTSTSKSHSSDASTSKSHSSDTATSKSHISHTATSKSHISDTATSKSHISDTATSKSHSSDTATSKSHRSHTATSKSHSSHTATSKSHSSHTATSKSHSSDTATSKSHRSHTATSKSHSSHTATSKSHSSDLSTSKSHRIHLSFPKSPHVDSNHSDLFHFNATSSKSKVIDTKQLLETFRTPLPIQTLVQSPSNTTAIGNFNKHKSLMLKYQLEKDGNIRVQNNFVENQRSNILLSKTSTTAAELEKHSSTKLTPKTCKESKQNRKKEINTASQPAASIGVKDVLTKLKVRGNDALVLTNHLKTSSKKVMKNLKKHFPHECRCHPEEQRSVMADQIVLYEEKFLMLRYLPSITMLLIHGQEMTGQFYEGMWYISIAEIKHKLLANQGRDHLDIYLSEHSSEVKYLAKDLRNYLMRQGTTRIQLQHEYMITVQSLRKFQSDLHQMQGVVPWCSFWSMASMDENFYIKKSGQMWCMACLGHMVQESSSIDVYTDIELTIAQPVHKDCRDKVSVGEQQTSVTHPGAARTITSPESLPQGHESSVSSETITSHVKNNEDPDGASSGLTHAVVEDIDRSGFGRTNRTYSGLVDLKSVDKTDLDIIKFGFVIINKTPFTAFKLTNICFVSVYQLQMKQVVLLNSIEKHLKRLNTFPRKAPKVVEKHLQQINSSFTNTKWLDTNTLRCVCCMVSTPGVLVNKNLINSIISGKIHEHFEYAFQSTDNMENDNSGMATRYSHISGQEMCGPDEDPISVTTDQVGTGPVRKALKRSYSCLSSGISTASEPQENKMVENLVDVHNGNHSNVQNGQNSEQSDFSLPLDRKKLKIPFQRRKQKKQSPILIRKREPKATISHHSLKQPDLNSQNLDVTESMITATGEQFDPYGSPAVHKSTPNDLDESQIIIKTEPMEYDDDISSAELPTVVIERETVEHEHLQEAVTVGLSPVDMKLTRSSSKTDRIPEMIYIPAVTDNPTGNIHHKQSPHTVPDQGNGQPGRSWASNIDHSVKGEPDCEDNKAEYTDTVTHIKVEPCD